MNNALRSRALPTPSPYAEPVHGVSRYVLRALGGFALTLNERPIQEFGSNKARALLVYLLLERDRAHRRETLADLFWPERPARAAFNNLNQTLFTLRRALGDTDAAQALLRSDRFTVQLSPEAPIESDVAAFQRLSALDAAPPLADELPPSLVAAAACYQGPLLHGVSLRDAPGFDEWLTV
jgi:DNA-binding SARP family transcriptional activator